MANMLKQNQTPLEFIDKYKRLFSPSGSSRWLFCTGSVGLEVELRNQAQGKPQLSSAYASEGTCAHKLGAKCIESDISPFTFVNEEISAEDETDYKTIIDLEMANAVNIYVDFVLGLVRSAPGDSILEIEQTLDLTGISPYVHSGTADAWVFDFDNRHLHVCDLKYGKGIDVDVENNTQMMVYSLGVVQKLFKAYHIPLSGINKISLHIIQPRSNQGRNPIKTWELSPQVLPWFHELILHAIKSAFSPNPTFAPSESRCRWCPGSSRCPARAELSMKAAQLDFDHLVNHEVSIAYGTTHMTTPMGNVLDAIPEPILPNVHTLSNGEISAILRWEKRITSFLSSVSEYALNARVKGEKIPGFKLVQGRSIRRWRSEKEVLELLRTLPIPEKELYEKPKILPITKMEELLKSKKLDLTILNEVTMKPPGNLTLAPLTDKRPEVSPLHVASKDFQSYKED